jgi:hypothetical protein
LRFGNFAVRKSRCRKIESKIRGQVLNLAIDSFGRLLTAALILGEQTTPVAGDHGVEVADRRVHFDRVSLTR